MKLRKAITRQIKVDNRKEKLHNFINNFKKQFESETLEQQAIAKLNDNTLNITEEIVIGTLIDYRTIPGGLVPIVGGCIRLSDTNIMEFAINDAVIKTESTKLFNRCNKILGNQYKIRLRTRYMKDGNIRQYITYIL